MSAVDSRVPPGGYRRREQEAKHRKATNPALKHWARILGSLRSTFSNLTPRLKTLVTRWKRGVYRVAQRPETALMEDSRGTVVRRIEHLQTFLTASGIDRLVGDYLTGATVAQLAEQYGVHRATVSAHLTRRGVTRRQPALGIEEAAEAVKLYRGGVSMRSIAQSMGVGRKAVRRALVEASAIGEPE